jgi:hypothetical protein
MDKSKFANDVWLKEIVQNSLQDLFMQTWLENIHLSYRLFKHKLE